MVVELDIRVLVDKLTVVVVDVGGEVAVRGEVRVLVDKLSVGREVLVVVDDVKGEVGREVLRV